MQRLSVDGASLYVLHMLVREWQEQANSASVLSKLLRQLKGCEDSDTWQGRLYELAFFTTTCRKWMGGRVAARIW